MLRSAPLKGSKPPPKSIRWTIADLVGMAAPALRDATTKHPKEEYWLYETWNAILMFIALQQSNRNHFLAVAPQFCLKFDIPVDPTTAAIETRSISTATISTDATSRTSISVALGSTPDTLPAPKSNEAPAASTASLAGAENSLEQRAEALESSNTIPPQHLRKRAAFKIDHYFRSIEDAHYETKSRIPDFVIICYRAKRRSLPLIVEIKPLPEPLADNNLAHTINRCSAQYDSAKMQIYQQAKCAFDTFSYQPTVHVLFVVGSYWFLRSFERKDVEDITLSDDNSAFDPSAGDKKKNLRSRPHNFSSVWNDDCTNLNPDFKKSITNMFKHYSISHLEKYSRGEV